MRFYGVVSNQLAEAIELFPTRQEAEAVVRASDEGEPDQAGALSIEPTELVTGSAN